MNVAAARLDNLDTPNIADRALGLAGWLTAAYLAVMTWPMWLDLRTTGVALPLAIHLATLAFVIAALAARRTRFGRMRDWIILGAGPVMYVELRWIIPAIGAVHRDAAVLAWEGRLFPSNPSATLAPRLHWLAFSELLHLAYASYYLLMYLPPLVMYARGARAQFAATMLALTLVYGCCFVTYALFPVDGPRYLVGAAAAPDGPIRSFVLALLDRGSSRGTAFPSSHVAASLVAALCAYRFDRRLGSVVAVLASLLTLATVYGGFHYAVDALVGVMLGFLAWATSGTLWTVLESREAQTATAA
jgi:membrane-associated phospholipid phosphatase